jgi:hypothetical protein
MYNSDPFWFGGLVLVSNIIFSSLLPFALFPPMSTFLARPGLCFVRLSLFLPIRVEESGSRDEELGMRRKERARGRGRGKGEEEV